MVFLGHHKVFSPGQADLFTVVCMFKNKLLSVGKSHLFASDSAIRF